MKSLLILNILALILSSFALGDGGRHVVYLPVGSKVYAFLPPFRINKSHEQMQAEAGSARRRYTAILDAPSQPLPRQKDLLDFLTPVKDQGHRGACSAFATVGLLETLVGESAHNKVNLSEQFLYWASKAVMHYVPNSDGVEHIQQMLDTAVKVGTTTQQVWPYESFAWFQLPKLHPDCSRAYQQNPEQLPTECITNGKPAPAAQNAPRVKLSAQIQTETAPEAIVALINTGHPVEIGIDIYETSWQMRNRQSVQFRAGKISMPQLTDFPGGGHAVVIVGYDLDAKVYLFKNSWGTDEWAREAQWVHNGTLVRVPGLGTIPMDYVRQFGEAGTGKLN